MAGPVAIRLPGRYGVQALAVAARRQLAAEWRGSPPHRWMLARPAPQGLAATPRDLRPPDPKAGARILAGAFVLAGATLTVGPKGDPWDRPSPDRAFAVALHRMDWLRDVLAAGPAGPAEALRLVLDWRRAFGRWNAFSWSLEVLERRVFNLACAIRAVTAPASDAEAADVALDLARQARCLLQVGDGPARAAERAAAAAVAGAALGGPASDRLLAEALARLDHALPAATPEAGGHGSRSPQAALELLFDLLTLEDALSQRGLAPSPDLAGAIEQLSVAVRFFTLADGALAAFQGGEACPPAYVSAIRRQEDAAPPPPASLGGYHRLEGQSLQVIIDAAPPARGAWSATACAQPLAVEVLTGGRRLIVGGGWSPLAQGPQAMRLVDAASTASLGDAACGEPLRGFPARILGPRLVGVGPTVEVRRDEAPGALWLEATHEGWVGRFGLRHERRLYIDTAADELRGEDRFTPAGAAGDGRRFVPFIVRFHLHPQVAAMIARDRKSVLLRAEGQEQGWWLRSDAGEAALEPSVHYQDGQARRSQQVVLRGQARVEKGARLRWKLSAAESR
jgi:uncharacterized heparinase superfamily protein